MEEVVVEVVVEVVAKIESKNLDMPVVKFLAVVLAMTMVKVVVMAV